MDIINIILHLDKYIGVVLENYHSYFYILFFLVIFCETGLVVTPFLPGDSLLFVAGAFAGAGQLHIGVLIVILILAAFLGDNTNFIFGKFVGDKLFSNPNSKIFRRDILAKTHEFYERHGSKAIIIARFIPLVRTFAPFVAGLGHMTYRKFVSFSLIASLLWVIIFLCGGFLFGNIPVIKEHMSLIIIAVMVISVLPALKMIWDAKFKTGK
ncbi:MAG TPA: DedA family protein [Burkholderiales bacterium]|nr:DedA family protein [Burkholderiales bacterium]